MDTAGNICLPDFNFFLISEQTGLNPTIDGILGMSRPMAPPGKTDWHGVGPVFLEHLAAKNVLPTSTFAIYLESYEDEKAQNVVSFVDIGGYVAEHMRQGEEPVWFDLAQTMYWMIEGTTGAKFVNYRTASEKSFRWLKQGPVSYPVILDSGTSLSMVPQALYTPFMK